MNQRNFFSVSKKWDEPHAPLEPPLIYKDILAFLLEPLLEPLLKMVQAGGQHAQALQRLPSPSQQPSLRNNHD